VTGLLIDRKDFNFLRLHAVVMAVLLVGFLLTKLLHLNLPTGIHINVAFGYLIALTVIPWLDRLPSANRWDKLLGLFSFPLFLCHEVVAVWVQNLLHLTSPGLFLVAAVLFSGLLILAVEIPFDRIRYAVRQPAKPET